MNSETNWGPPKLQTLPNQLSPSSVHFRLTLPCCLFVLIVLIVSLPMIRKSCTTASHVHPSHVPSSSVKYKSPEVMYIPFSSNINYDPSYSTPLLLKLPKSLRNIPWASPRHFWASLNLIPLQRYFTIIFGIFPSLGTPLKHWALLTLTLTLPWPETSSHFTKPQHRTLQDLQDRTLDLVPAWALSLFEYFQNKLDYDWR